jgi:hypothetical protein
MTFESGRFFYPNTQTMFPSNLSELKRPVNCVSGRFGTVAKTGEPFMLRISELMRRGNVSKRKER